MGLSHREVEKTVQSWNMSFLVATYLCLKLELGWLGFEDDHKELFWEGIGECCIDHVSKWELVSRSKEGKAWELVT